MDPNINTSKCSRNAKIIKDKEIQHALWFMMRALGMNSLNKSNMLDFHTRLDFWQSLKSDSPFPINAETIEYYRQAANDSVGVKMNYKKQTTRAWLISVTQEKFNHFMCQNEEKQKEQIFQYARDLNDLARQVAGAGFDA